MPLRWLLIAAIALVACTTDLTAQLRSDLPPPAWEPIGARITWKGLSFIVPPGMTGTPQGDAYEMTGLGVLGRAGQCAIMISGEIPARGDLGTYAQDLLVANMASLGVGITDSQGGSNLAADRRVGRSADGWRYVELNGMVTAGGANRARLMLIERGSTVVPILAVANPSNGCVGLSNETTPNGNTITWLAFYYSLKLVGATPSDHLRGQVIGRWGGSGASAAAGAGMVQDEIFATNGQYDSNILGGAPTGLVSSTGAGRYVVDADKLAVYPAGGKPEAYLFRVVEDFSVLTPSRSTLQLCKIKFDVGGPHERCLSRSN